MQLAIQLSGIGLILLAAVDIFLTVLYARSGVGLLSPHINSTIWRLFRLLARLLPQKRGSILSFSGPLVLVTLFVIWVLMLLFGFALIFWPALGSAVRAAQGTTSTDFLSALYFSGFCLATLGTGDIVAYTPFYRLLMIGEAIFGFSFFTLFVTYTLSIYSAVRERNAFALSLHHQTIGSGDATVFLNRYAAAGNMGRSSYELSVIQERLAQLIEMHEFYPILFYFRFEKNHYGLARLMSLVLDIASLLRVVEQPAGKGVAAESVNAEWLRHSADYFMLRLLESYPPQRGRSESRELSDEEVRQWSDHYRQLVASLGERWAEERYDVEGGLQRYLSEVVTWYPSVLTCARRMLYRRQEVMPFLSPESED